MLLYSPKDKNLVQRSEGKFLSPNSSHYFLFLNQLIRNIIPIKKAIPEICIAQDSIYHSNGFLINTTIYTSPARIKAIPPTISYFQDISRTTSKTSAGILCINNAPIVCQKLDSEEKTSNDINAKKDMNIMDRILGVQYTNLLIFFSIFQY